MSELVPPGLGWPVEALRAIIDPTRPITYGVVQPGTRLEQGIPIIRGQDYSRGIVDDSELYLVHPSIAAAYKRSEVKGGDILFSIVGYLGQTAVVPDNLTGANITQTTARIAIKQPHNFRYFLQQFRSDRFAAEVRKYQKGSAQPGLNLADVEKMAVVVPPPETQKRIALVLDTADEAIARTEAMIAKLWQVRAGLLHDLLTRGLDVHGHLRDPIAQPEQFHNTRFGLIPKKWHIKSFAEAAADVSLGTTIRGVSGGKRTIPLLKMGNLLWGTLNLGSIEEVEVDRIPNLEPLRLQYRDFLFNTRNTPELVGKTAIWRNELPEATHDNNLLRVRFKPEVVSPFVCLWMSNGVGKNMVFGLATATTSVAAIYWRDLARLLLPFPATDEQEAIVAKVEAMDAVLEQESSGLQKLKYLKSGLMTDLLTGRVRVPETIGTTL